MFACLYLPSAAAEGSDVEPDALEAVARAFSPRVERHGPQLVTLDAGGLGRLLGTPADIGRELQREARDRGCQAHVALAATRTAAMLIACSHAGVTIIPPGEEQQALATLPLGLLQQLPAASGQLSAAGSGSPANRQSTIVNRQSSIPSVPVLDLFRRWGLRTLGDVSGLPPPALSARIGQEGLRWQQLARGEDLDPLVPLAPAPPIEETLELDWPVEGLEPLSFLLPRLLEPIADRLERLDQAAITLEMRFRLASREQVTRQLQLPAPMRDPKVLRTLVLLHLESHPLESGVERLTIRVEPAPARIVQFSLLARALPFPEQMATLLARLGALMGERRVGAPAVVDSYRPGAFAMQPFTVVGPVERTAPGRQVRSENVEVRTKNGSTASATRVSALSSQFSVGADAPRVVVRRFRLPVPARVIVQDGRPARITTERRGLEGGRVEAAAGPWRTSGDWWRVGSPSESNGWNRDEWDVALGDGAVYRVYRDRVTERWFIDGIVD